MLQLGITIPIYYLTDDNDIDYLIMTKEGEQDIDLGQLLADSVYHLMEINNENPLKDRLIKYSIDKELDINDYQTDSGEVIDLIAFIIECEDDWYVLYLDKRIVDIIN